MDVWIALVIYVELSDEVIFLSSVSVVAMVQTMVLKLIILQRQNLADVAVIQLY